LALVAFQTHLVERLVSEAVRLEELVEHEQRQRRALEVAESEREREREERLRVQKALEESRRIEALARMAGGIAHDFNNSLTVIMGAAEEVGLARSLGEANERASEIVEAAQRSAGLTRQLLTLGRHQVLQAQSFLLAPMVERLRAAFRRILPDDVSPEVPGPASDLLVHVDATELERALFNLVLNARDAMPDGGCLRVTCCGRTLGSQQAPNRPWSLASPTTRALGSAGLRVLLCSGYLQEELLRRGVEAGRYAFLPKPFSSKELVTAVRSLVLATSG
jgi:signal transduction histidine kinase